MNDYSDASDAELMARLRLGDAGAFEALLRRYWPALVAYASRVCGRPEASEDVVQRTFHRLWERRSGWQAAGSVRGLLYRIAHNLAISEHRSQGARERVAAAADPMTEPPTPLALLENAELRGALDLAIQALPPRRREVFVLRCIHGMSYKEIAAVTRTSPQTVANQLSRALSSLRDTLRPLLDE